MMLGKFKFMYIAKVSPFLGPFIFFIFSLSTSLVLINILLTIVICTFFEVKERILKQPNEFEIMEYINRRICSTLGINRRRKVSPDGKVGSEKTQSKDEIQQFSHKVNLFLNHVNKVYLNDSVKLKGNKKRLIKPDMMKEETKFEKNHTRWIAEEVSHTSNLKYWWCNDIRKFSRQFHSNSSTFQGKKVNLEHTICLQRQTASQARITSLDSNDFLKWLG
ncbi:Polycystin-2 [Nymphon striatum]|nr:Polycystin-2 [Nymphon striatum]